MLHAPVNGYFDDFLPALRSADLGRARSLVQEALARGLPAQRVLDQVVVAGLAALGQGWEDGSVSLTQVYMGGRIAEQLVSGLLPQGAQPSAPWGKVVIGTLGDYHGLGQRIVAAYLSAAGAQVVSLGLGVEPETFVRRAREEEADLIAISVLMYVSARRVRRVRELLDQEPRPVPLLVGGAPFNQDSRLWQQVGATAVGGNPVAAVTIARRLIGGER
ncbi:MAG: cobalamin B12-binding domain-containing protein [Chloroflexi bacterium]|nr:cobalamin B12-binding domain-containing protein [Chloroflexota bacterium]